MLGTLLPHEVLDGLRGTRLVAPPPVPPVGLFFLGLSVRRRCVPGDALAFGPLWRCRIVAPRQGVLRAAEELPRACAHPRQHAGLLGCRLRRFLRLLRPTWTA